MVFSRMGQLMEELVNQGLNDTGWDKELCDFVKDCPVPAPLITVRVQVLFKACGTRREEGRGKIY